MILFRTAAPEEAAKQLSKQYGHVILRCFHFMRFGPRVRLGLFDDERTWIGRRLPASARQYAQWEKSGGILLNYRREYSPPAHDAHVFMECPLSVEDLERHSEGAAIVVLSVPTAWTLHEEEIAYRWPSEAVCKRFYEILRSAGPAHGDVAKAAGIPDGLHAVSDAALADMLGIHSTQMPFVRKCIVSFRKHAVSVYQLAPRIDPADKTLLPLYRHIVEKLPALGELRLSVNSELSKTSQFWKVQLRKLIRSGSVENKGRIGFYRMDEISPDWERIAADHEGAKLKLDVMRLKAEALPEFTPEALARLQPFRPVKSRRSSAPAPRAGAAPTDRKAS